MFEKVNPAHPDKIADRIAGALVDLAYEQEYNPRIAVEVLIGHGVCHIITETSVSLPMAEVGEIVSRIAGGSIFVDYHELAQDPILAKNQSQKTRCGDNGIFRGVPVTEEQAKLSRYRC
jgi:S-adenosylmethionine synthetase